MSEPHVCDFRKVRPCPHAHVRSVDPKRMGPTVPSTCMCCGESLLFWQPWGGR
jgi:hypothetical protein